ncbi:dTDP-4-dehydrorhamnose reductase [Marinomonas spartinae]|uniref:dTDP-4-dehydrorhamnose reductase n=1 Tax=Marinomonas spartinae TaxID=1792290 RepID=UPI000808DCBB|nr:dTDP-4-dehydrorhamnose reductase [Marinomonas spartinae]SBS40452.1 dTDP-4-dehydrorhamnose reductase [Marinomonas spartinae]
MRVLLVGKNGQLGSCFQDIMKARPDYELFAFDSNELDITNRQQVSNRFKEVAPDIIVNASAYTAVDKAESETALAFSVNEQGVKHLVEQANKLDIPLIHVSTDYVFDGSGITPYKANDTTNPQGVYGASKLAGECVTTEGCNKYIILRTSWVFSEYGNNFVKTMLRLAKERDSLSVVADQYGCPTYAGDLAVTIQFLCEQYQLHGSLEWGCYHYCGNLATSWHGFARSIFSLAQRKGMLDQPPRLSAISSDEYPTPAKRPAFSVMDTAELSRLGVTTPNWLNSLNDVLDKLS